MNRREVAAERALHGNNRPVEVVQRHQVARFRRTRQHVVGKNVTLVDSARETAKEVKIILEENGLAKRAKEKPEYRFYVSDEPALFKKIGEKFLRRPIERIEKIEIELRERYVYNRSAS